MTRPRLRQFSDLRHSDFREHPVWISCHIADYDEPWYDETDEETFRPWLGPLPVDPAAAMFLVTGQLVTRGGEEFQGFFTPSAIADDFGTLQPHMFVGGHPFGFWVGSVPVAAEAKSEFYSGLGRSSRDVFPISFSARPEHTQGVVTFEIPGFLSIASGGLEVEQ